MLVTGGSSGIGLALAQGFSARGSRVLICGRNEQKLQAAQEQLPNIAYLVADVAKAGDRQRLLAWIEAEHPDLNVLVNNAGLQSRIDLVSGAVPVDLTEIATNLAAPIEPISLFLPRLLSHAEHGLSAAIINVTSGLGYVPLAATPVYCATKAGLQAYTRALRHQLRHTDVRVVDIAPPAVDTELLRGAMDPTGGRSGGPPIMTPDAFAKAALRALERDHVDVRIGGAQLLYVLNRLAPNFAFRLLNRLAS